MKIQRFARLFVLSCLLLFISIANVLAQKRVDPNAFQVVRTKSMSKKAGFGPGGTIVIVGAPHGAVSIEGWDKNRIEIEAEIQVRAHNEQDAARLANVTGFAVTEDVTSYRIFSIGPHDKKSIKKIDKKFPKKLRKNPFKIDYKLKVPYYSDLRIDGGVGNLELKNVEGFMQVNFLQSDAVLRLIGGSIRVTVGSGSMDVTIATRSWRGRDAQIQLNRGDLSLRLPKNLNADLYAQVLRTGKITNSYENLSPRPRTEFSNTLMNAIAGSGGAPLAFTVGDGSLKILDSEKPAE